MKRAASISLFLSIVVILVLLLSTFSLTQPVRAYLNIPYPTITDPPASGNLFDPAPDSVYVSTSGGYGQREFFMAGTANVYDNTSTSGFATTVRTSGIPYKTRILVRYPLTKTKFSGNVIVEFMNPTSEFDIATGWLSFRNHIVHNGDIWVGMTSRALIINNANAYGPAFGVNYGLVSFNSARYSTLTFGGGTPIAGSTYTGNPGWYQKALDWDMFAQLGALIKSNDTTSPLYQLGFTGSGGVKAATYLIGHGYSQTGGYMITYINFFSQKFDGLWVSDGHSGHLYDGYNPAAAGGPSWINDDDLKYSTNSFMGCSFNDPRRFIQDVGVPVSHMCTETEVDMDTNPNGGKFLSVVVTRRGDSTVFRHYEVAGSSHETAVSDLWLPTAADQAAAYVNCPHNCCTTPYSDTTDFPTQWAFDGILYNLENWIANFGTYTPPTSCNITVDATGIVRDGKGTVADYNGRIGTAKGGLRTPWTEVPVKEYLPYCTPCSSCPSVTCSSGCNTWCILYGRAYTLCGLVGSLYSGNADYLTKFNASVDSLTTAKWFDPADVAQIKSEQAAAGLPSCGATRATVYAGQGIATFSINGGGITGLVNIPSDSIPCSAGGYIFPFGMFSYSIVGLSPGGTSVVTITTPTPLPMGSKIFKCQNGSLVDFTQYVQQTDPNTFILTLKDGGQGDADGIANGTIVDPCGPAYNIINPRHGSSAQLPTVAQPPAPMANIAVQSASLSTAKVAPGAPVTVTANVANKGTAQGSTQIKLYVNGQEEANQGVTLSGGTRTPVKFTVSRDDPGTYSVYVGSIPAGTFEVDQFANPNLILYISGALILFALVGGVIFMATRRR